MASPKPEYLVYYKVITKIFEDNGFEIFKKGKLSQVHTKKYDLSISNNPSELKIQDLYNYYIFIKK
jgi:hypothetical protein